MASRDKMRVLKILWISVLSIMTAVLLVAPRPGGSGSPWSLREILLVVVIVDCWLIAIFLFTPLSEKIGNKPLLKDRVSHWFIIGILGFLYAFFIMIAWLQHAIGVLIILILIGIAVIYNTVWD